jgi:putative SOS response-associated peptidase YedK
MCNENRRRVALDLVVEGFSQVRIPLRFPEGMPNLEPLDSIRITDRNAIVRAPVADPDAPPGSAELVVRRWSWPGPGGKPVYNFRSEGREFGNSESGGRCLIVADGFYEFTSPQVEPGAPKPKRKDKWLFTKKDEPFFCIAGIWRTSAEVGEAFTMLTAEPGPDVAPYHSRQIIILDRADWASWLDPQVPARELLKPAPAGTFDVEKVV